MYQISERFDYLYTGVINFLQKYRYKINQGLFGILKRSKLELFYDILRVIGIIYTVSLTQRSILLYIVQCLIQILMHTAKYFHEPHTTHHSTYQRK